MTERKYLPTIADLIDRLSITLMKSIFIERDTYRAEMKLIMQDLSGVDLAGLNSDFANVRLVYAILVLMLANRYIWENEARVREGVTASMNSLMLADLLRLTHSINGVRNRAKNEINKIFGERVDGKIDCLAADLPPEFGSWNVFSD